MSRLRPLPTPPGVAAFPQQQLRSPTSSLAWNPIQSDLHQLHRRACSAQRAAQIAQLQYLYCAQRQQLDDEFLRLRTQQDRALAELTNNELLQKQQQRNADALQQFVNGCEPDDGAVASTTQPQPPPLFLGRSGVAPDFSDNVTTSCALAVENDYLDAVHRSQQRILDALHTVQAASDADEATHYLEQLFLRQREQLQLHGTLAQLQQRQADLRAQQLLFHHQQQLAQLGRVLPHHG
eukprot:gnl/Spiro4/7316_TR3830_c0_g1_i1.p1 gnl/Spiro4/7316_TR3830_c0_g1~~gnl/Spiro4/7316_TR3830_c0_g1_i1.p1  ORF type:complete len:252 (+),score=87.80 gnl/Spiro4/7316_TR3830_c0_g1_i1:47-757(+)